MQFSGRVHVDGVIEGRIDASEDVTLGRSGVVRGWLRARHVNVSGLFEGDLVCTSLHIERDGQVRANLCCDELSIDSRGCFIGERRKQGQPARLEYRPQTAAPVESGAGELFDHELIDTLPDRIILGRQEG